MNSPKCQTNFFSFFRVNSITRLLRFFNLAAGLCLLVVALDTRVPSWDVSSEVAAQSKEAQVAVSSDKASFVTGAYYPVDGGYLAR